MAPATHPQTDEDWQARIYDAIDAFSPGAPIDDLNLLAGRAKQIDQMLDAVLQRGQHAILYGERGVGKSSLANTFSTKLIGPTRTRSCIHINCDPSDNFTRLCRKIFRRLTSNGENLGDKYINDIYPDDLVYELSEFPLNTFPIIILDEFDKLTEGETPTFIANTIKHLSDRSIRTTIIIVGVADSVDGLIKEHGSISHCLRQIRMERMSPAELREIVDDRLPSLAMSIHQDAMAHLVALSRGLPHYAHLFGQQAAKKALEHRRLVIDIKHIEQALPVCMEQTDQSVRAQYHWATTSPRSGNIYKQVLLAAALSQVDEFGYFHPVALQNPLGSLLNRDVKVSLFGQHLKKLCQEDRGSVLEQTGSERKYIYRFVEPMMQPFILMYGLKNGLITREQVSELAASHYEPRLSSEF